MKHGKGGHSQLIYLQDQTINIFCHYSPNIDRFIRSKYGKEKIKYPHDALKDILSETYGIIVYQDQVLKIAQAFGGYTLGEADILRKAMGKKIKEVSECKVILNGDGADELMGGYLYFNLCKDDVEFDKE